MALSCRVCNPGVAVPFRHPDGSDDRSAAAPGLPGPMREPAPGAAPMTRAVGAAVALLLLSPAAAAQEPAAPSAAGGAAPEPVGEVTIIGRRPAVPDLREQMEYHDAEYRRLKRLYDPDPPPPGRGERLLSMPDIDAGKSAMPSPASDVVRNP